VQPDQHAGAHFGPVEVEERPWAEEGGPPLGVLPGGRSGDRTGPKGVNGEELKALDQQAANVCLVIRVLMLAAAVALASSMTPPTVRYVDAHVDVPYLRDCHGLFRHVDECVRP
jgi:hypothetical protein